MTIMKSLYRGIAKPILFKFDPEVIHDGFVNVGEVVGRHRILRSLVSSLYEYQGPDISKVVDGITYRTPVLLSAGFDNNGRLTQVLKSMSFGGEEIGSTTAFACEGNSRPRLTRLVRNQSIIVYKGLRNEGVDALIARLQRTPRIAEYVLGISIARTNVQESSVDVSAGVQDYVTSFKKLNEAGVGDYYTINISCPNSFTGETFVDPKNLPILLEALKQIPCTKPIYLKMPINLEWSVFAELLAIADKAGIHGVIIGNLNKSYKELDFPEDAPEQFRGGLSGKPCFERSNELIRKTRAAYGSRFTIIGVGGIFTPEDAMEKLSAGADLIQMITGMIFGDPGVMKDICDRYAKEHAR